MTQSMKIMAAVALFGFALTAVSLVAAPFNTSASAAIGSGEHELIAERIGGAFAAIGESGSAGRIAAKGDLPAAPDCASQTWPHVASDCIVTADGAPAPDVRFVTVGFQAGDAETVLLRLPADVTVHR